VRHALHGTYTRPLCKPHLQQNAPMEIEAATRAIGAAALRDAKMQRVKEDLRQLRSYVQSVVATTAWGTMAMVSSGTERR